MTIIPTEAIKAEARKWAEGFMESCCDGDNAYYHYELWIEEAGWPDQVIRDVFIEEYDAELERIAQRRTWWRDARWAYAIASQQQETMSELFLPGLSRDMFLLVNQWIDKMEARGQRRR